MRIIGSQRGWVNFKKKARKKVAQGKDPAPTKWQSYVKRNALLREMGYKDYAAYLAGDLWARIRTAKVTFQPYCVLCPNTVDQIHHLYYDAATLLGGNSHRLVGLCRACHDNIEREGEKRVKRTLGQANKVFFQLVLTTEQGRAWHAWYEKQELLAHGPRSQKAKIVERVDAKKAKKRKKK